MWAEWVERWNATTTMTHRSRLNSRAALLKTGRWIAAEQPEAADPGAWTRPTRAAWIAAVDRMKIGDFVVRASSLQERLGQPLQAASKASLVRAVRVFFRDIQDWEWLPRKFDPFRALAVPRNINAMIGPSPRVIADDVWAQAALGRAQPGGLRHSPRQSRPHLPRGAVPCHHADLAVLRSAQQRDRAPAPRMHPVAARRRSRRRQLRGHRPGCCLPAGRTRSQDRNGVHQTG